MLYPEIYTVFPRLRRTGRHDSPLALVRSVLSIERDT